METNENYSCVDCIWHDQCESDVPCEFFDAGHSGDTLTDEEVKAAVELNRQEYGKAYAEYVSEFSDGNIQIDENDDEPYDDNDFEEIETE
jgi:hypothetical protein